MLSLIFRNYSSYAWLVLFFHPQAISGRPFFFLISYDREWKRKRDHPPEEPPLPPISSLSTLPISHHLIYGIVVFRLFSFPTLSFLPQNSLSWSRWNTRCVTFAVLNVCFKYQAWGRWAYGAKHLTLYAWVGSSCHPWTLKKYACVWLSTLPIWVKSVLWYSLLFSRTIIVNIIFWRMGANTKYLIS